MSEIRPEDHGKLLSVGEVAKRSGVAVSALHFYERKGLIESVRNSGNQRRYKRDVLRRVAIIKVAQRVGIPLTEIAEAFSTLPRGRTPDVADWEKMSRIWHDDLNERIQALTALRDQLTGCIGCGCLSIASCPLRNYLDRLSDSGPGAHFPPLR